MGRDLGLWKLQIPAVGLLCSTAILHLLLAVSCAISEQGKSLFIPISKSGNTWKLIQAPGSQTELELAAGERGGCCGAALGQILAL